MKRPFVAHFLTLAMLAGSCPTIGAARPQQSSTAKSPSTSSSTSNSSARSKSTSTSKKKKASKRRSTKREPFQKAPTPERISEIQSALARGGYYQASPNGKWDVDTVGAMQKFQSDNGMNPSGKLDARSLQKLGLGSSTAGVDAPKPVSHRAPTATLSSSGASPPASSATSAVNSTPSTDPTPTHSSSATAKPPQH